jgi:hypothetical protein
MFHAIERIFLRVLLVWALLSMVLGIVGLQSARADAPTEGQQFLGAFSMQFLIWGAIDAALAGLGLRGVARREASALPVDDEFRRRDRAIGVLRFNAKLDVLWIAIGAALLLLAIPFPGGRGPLLGHGLGVILQGGFLIVFDLVFARRLAAVRDAPV